MVQGCCRSTKAYAASSATRCSRHSGSRTTGIWSADFMTRFSPPGKATAAGHTAASGGLGAAALVRRSWRKLAHMDSVGSIRNSRFECRARTKQEHRCRRPFASCVPCGSTHTSTRVRTVGLLGTATGTRVRTVVLLPLLPPQPLRPRPSAQPERSWDERARAGVCTPPLPERVRTRLGHDGARAHPAHSGGDQHSVCDLCAAAPRHPGIRMRFVNRMRFPLAMVFEVWR